MGSRLFPFHIGASQLLVEAIRDLIFQENTIKLAPAHDSRNSMAMFVVAAKMARSVPSIKIHHQPILFIILCAKNHSQKVLQVLASLGLGSVTPDNDDA